MAREFGHRSGLSVSLKIKGFSAKGTLIDQMITMIDEYSANLEEIVAERTKLLEEQHDRTEALLYRLLPRYEGKEDALTLSARPDKEPNYTIDRE